MPNVNQITDYLIRNEIVKDMESAYRHIDALSNTSLLMLIDRVLEEFEG